MLLSVSIALRTLFSTVVLGLDRLMKALGSVASLAIDGIDYYLKATAYFDSVLNVINGRVDPSNKAIFITGCEYEFALLLAKKLDELGYIVFAAVRELNDSVRENFESVFGPNSNARLIQCDVIKYREVTESAKLVDKVLGHRRYLWAVISSASFISHGSMINNDFDKVLKIAALGSARITKAFLPLLKLMKRSRVIFVTSPSIASQEIPAHVSYAFSRAAETSFGYVLRKELRPLDIYVSIFEPTSLAEARRSSGDSLPNSPSTTPPVTPDTPDSSESCSTNGASSGRQINPLFSNPIMSQASRRRSSISQYFPCLNLIEERRNEAIEQLAALICSPNEPALFVSAKAKGSRI